MSCSDGDSDLKVQALSLDDVAAYWAVRGQNVEGLNYIHPVVRFRVVNGAPDPVGYVQAMAVFKREKFPDESWGNAFAYSISEEALTPGGQSDVITMRSDSNFVSRDTPEQMFDNDPALRAEFEQRLAEDEEFAASPRARLTWIYERSPLLDTHWRLYPVGFER